MGPRPDHIVDPAYDPSSIDLPGLHLLGERQEKFLNQSGQDWTGAEMKAVLSRTAFCWAMHMHGAKDPRLLADLDCNGSGAVTADGYLMSSAHLMASGGFNINSTSVPAWTVSLASSHLKHPCRNVNFASARGVVR